MSNKSSVLTVRLPRAVGQGVCRLAARLGDEPSQLGVRLVEEGLRRRDFPLIDWRENSTGRTAYLKGTRLAVYWVVDAIQGGLSADKFARAYDLSVGQVRAALAYAQTFPDEMEADAKRAKTNRRWIEQQDATGHRRASRSKPKGRRQARR